MSDDNGKSQAEAQYASICEMVRALDVDYDRLDMLVSEFESEMTEAERSEWVKANCVEMTELQEAANGCENQDAARDRIQEDPLSVEVRSGWCSPGDEDRPPEEFQILLATGGPAVRIMGELDEYGQPSRATVEYQNWGTPWTKYFDVDEAVLLRYSSMFYFGG